MRRFSQKNALVTLADINVTPLLDLAFVLLIIFVITTPLLEQSIRLDLPKGGSPDDPRLERRDIKTVEVSAEGRYQLDGQALTLEQLVPILVSEAGRNPRMVVDVRADGQVDWEVVAALMDRCQRSGITRFRPRFFPER